MGFFEKIFGSRKETQKEASAGVFRFLRGYTPTFTDFNGSIFESDMIRAALDAHGRHAAKLTPQFSGSAQEYLKNRLRIAPNEWQTWPQFLYRHAVILYAKNTVFTVPVRGKYDEINGIIDIVPEKWELVEYRGEPWIRFFFDRGKRAAVSLYECGIQNRFQYKNELFGEENDALKSTLDLIEIQKQGVKEGIKNSASYRFYATHNNFSRDEDLAKERERFDSMNFRDGGGGGILLFPMQYKDVHQAESKPYTVDADQQKLIKENVFDYFGVNEDILQNKAFGDTWLAFYEGAVEWFAIQTGESLSRMLYTLREREYGNQVFFTSNRLQYMSNKDKLSAIQAFADRGLMTRNELREIMNLAPLPAPYGDQIPARGEYYNVNEEPRDGSHTAHSQDNSNGSQGGQGSQGENNGEGGEDNASENE